MIQLFVYPAVVTGGIGVLLGTTTKVASFVGITARVSEVCNSFYPHLITWSRC
jgi:hypothetical protein